MKLNTLSSINQSANKNELKSIYTNFSSLDKKTNKKLLNYKNQKFTTAINNQTYVVNYNQLQLYLIHLLKNNLLNNDKLILDLNNQLRFKWLTNNINYLNSYVSNKRFNYLYDISKVKHKLYNNQFLFNINFDDALFSIVTKDQINELILQREKKQEINNKSKKNN